MNNGRREAESRTAVGLSNTASDDTTPGNRACDAEEPELMMARTRAAIPTVMPEGNQSFHAHHYAAPQAENGLKAVYPEMPAVAAPLRRPLGQWVFLG